MAEGVILGTSLKYEYLTQIKEYHLDTFGHVNNARYLDLFEEARWEAVTQRGYGLRDVHRLQQGPVILSIKLDFKKELRNRQKITITTQTTKYEGKIGEIVQEILNDKGELCCLAHFVVGFFDLKERRLIPPTKEWLHAIGWPTV